MSRTVFHSLSFNGHGIKSKIHHLAAELSTLPTLPDLISICETWCDQSILFTLHPFDEYVIFRKDRNKNGGGVLIMILKKFQPSECKINTLNTESVWCQCNLGIVQFIFGCVYRPPEHNTEMLQNISSCINTICNTYFNHKLIIYGDFNFPSIIWNADTPSSTNDLEIQFIECLLDNNLSQLTNFPTRILNTLDLVITNIPNNCTCFPTPNLISSDHECISLNFNYDFYASTNGTSYQYSRKHICDFKHADFFGLNNYLLSINWFITFSNCTDINCMWNCFLKIFNDATQQFVPLKSVRSTSKHHKKYVPHYIRKLIQKKNKLWKLYKHTNCLAYKRKHKSLCLHIANECRLSNLHKVHCLARSKNTKAFYSHINNSLGRNSIPTISLFDNTSKNYLSNQDACTRFADYFESIFKKHDTTLPDFQPNILPTTHIDYIAFDTFDIKQILLNLNNSWSQGPDGFSCLLLKNIACSVSLPLSLMFQRSIHSSKLPDAWKQACIIPIFKGKGSHDDVTNYRPISLTSVVCKVMETVIKNQLMDFCLQNNLISSQQHGFLSNKSTITNLLELTNDLTINRDLGNNVDMICIDFAKAFDTVPHNQLLHKLSHYGISGKLLNWLSDFLVMRKMFVRINDVTSDLHNVSSSVPQGSVLSGLLFVLYINDICKVIVNSNALLYADDLTLYRSVNNEHDAALLQADLQAICDWAKTWLLELNLLKCKILHIGNCSFTYHINNTPLSVSTCEKILGVSVDNNLSFKEHIFNIVKKARQTCNLLLSAFKDVDRSILIRLYKTYVLSSLEYASVIYSPHYLYLINMIENVQRNFTKRLHGLHELNYTQRLSVCNLQPLEHRRLYNDMCYVYKILHGNMFVNTHNRLTLTHNVHETRGNVFKLFKYHAKIEIRLNHFFHRCVNIWNNLPNDIVCAPNLALFKKRLTKYVFTLRGQAVNA